MATFEPISPAKVANGDSAFQGFRQTLPDYILGVPSLVEVGFDPDPLFFSHLTSSEGMVSRLYKGCVHERVDRHSQYIFSRWVPSFHRPPRFSVAAF